MGEIPADIRAKAKRLAPLGWYDHGTQGYETLQNAIAEAILAERNRDGWQDIESAPTDWSDLLLYDPEYQNDFHKVFQGYFDADQGDWLDCHGVIVSPTMWMPLPSPPDHKNTELRNEA